jgi:hypothetical protein
MRSILWVLVFASRISSYVIGDPRPAPTSSELEDDEFVFQKLLSKTDPEALHAALHNLSPSKFKHGAYHKDHTAAEAIHKDDPSLATSIVVLARRQAPDSSNSSAPATSTTSESVSQTPSPTTEPTSNSSPPPTTSVVVVTPTTPTTVVVVTTAPTTQASPSSTPTVVASTTPGNSPSLSPTSSPSATSNAPSSMVTSVVSNAQTTTTLTEVQSESSQGSTPQESSSKKGGTTANGPGPGQQTSIYLSTLTLPDGAQETISVTSYVGAAQTGSPSSGSDQPSTTSAGGSLQSQGSSADTISWSWSGFGAIGGVIGLLAVL